MVRETQFACDWPETLVLCILYSLYGRTTRCEQFNPIISGWLRLGGFCQPWRIISLPGVGRSLVAARSVVDKNKTGKKPFIKSFLIIFFFRASHTFILMKLLVQILF
jgi:hypothetical protein